MKNKKRTDGRYKSSVYLGKVDGKPKYKYFYALKQEEADEKAREYKRSLAKGVNFNSDPTFSEAVEMLLADKKATMSESEFKTLNSRLDLFVSELGNIKLKEIRKAQIQPILSDLALCNPTTGKPSAQRTVSRYLSACSAVFENAIENRIIDYNPCKYATPPKGLEKQERRALTMQEIRRIEETPHRGQLAAMIMIYSGLRKGELTALTWDDINLSERTITVNKSFDFKTGRIKTPKTAAGTRTVYIPQKLADYLGKQKRTCPLVVHNKDNKMLTLASWQKMWESYLLELDLKYGEGEKAKRYAPKKHVLTIEPFTIHECRHTFATLMYLAGVDILTAKEQLGHSEVRTTLDIYSHLDKIYKKNNISKLDELFTNG